MTARQRRKRKVRMFLIEMVILAVVLVVLYLFVQFGKISRNGITTDNDNLDPATLETLDGYTDIAVFGLDNRTSGEYENGRADVLMIFSINNDTNEVKMVSVYRDTYLNMTDDDEDFNKANAAYSLGGAQQAVEMLNENLDLNIQNYVSVDFEAVIDVIDQLGGVEEVEVTKNEAKLMKKPIKEVCKLKDVDPDTEYVSAGTQTLDGIQALAYMRIRKDNGGDFKRTKRQREIISKVIKQAKSSNIFTLNSMMNDLLPEISTSLTNSDMVTLLLQLFSYEVADSSGFPFEKTTMDLSVGNSVIAADLESNVIELHEFLYGTEDYTPSEDVQNFSDTIIYRTGIHEGDGY